MKNIPERDCKVLRSLQKGLLENYCDNSLAKLKAIHENSRESSHNRFIALYNTIEKENEELGYLFDDLRRSRALLTLIQWRRADLLTDEMLEKLTAETQATIEAMQEF